MKSKRYIPVNFFKPTNEIYEKEYERIFKKGKGKESSEVSETSQVILQKAGGFRKVYGRKGTKYQG